MFNAIVGKARLSSRSNTVNRSSCANPSQSSSLYDPENDPDRDKVEESASEVGGDAESTGDAEFGVRSPATEVESGGGKDMSAVCKKFVFVWLSYAAVAT